MLRHRLCHPLHRTGLRDRPCNLCNVRLLQCLCVHGAQNTCQSQRLVAIASQRVMKHRVQACTLLGMDHLKAVHCKRRERVQKLEGEVASLRSSNRRLQGAEASWAEAEARLAAHAATEQALRFQLSQLTATVKVCAMPNPQPAAAHLGVYRCAWCLYLRHGIMSVAWLRLQAVEASRTEVEACLAAHAAAEQALRFQLSQLTATVKVCSSPQAAASSPVHGRCGVVVLLGSLHWTSSAAGYCCPGVVAAWHVG